MRSIGAVENALFNDLAASLLFVALHAEEIFLPNGGFGPLLPLYQIEPVRETCAGKTKRKQANVFS
jgi:hypothetical protein